MGLQSGKEGHLQRKFKNSSTPLPPLSRHASLPIVPCNCASTWKNKRWFRSK
ncbi:hypothetical protein BC834DRAFT_896244 [Gloeopeniophorella convolvens]|nr:hypothetical protein BC834DRAFT_896244 [Gloeopeniophorella convolvens]